MIVQLKRSIVDLAQTIYKKYESKYLFDIQVKLLKGYDVNCIVDVGAAKGEVAREYRKRFKSTMIYCVEPFDASYRTLVRNVASDSRIKTRQLAISDKVGVAELYSNECAATNSLHKVDKNASHYWAPELLMAKGVNRIQTTTIDAFCESENISRIDILKMDIQGGEIAALSGARKMAADDRILMIYTEILMVPTYEGQSSLLEFLSCFSEMGFTLFDMGNFLHDTKGQVKQCDAVFINRTLANTLHR
ncbi:MAG: hypothetical protein A2036_01350 [Omnitrophica bacterium GWA2_50_21]|nr:MAG: hypothetical protein A2036_01350 [Omnitrophica bacterium GWA2_50_21]